MELIVKRMAETGSSLDLRSLTKHFGKLRVLDSVDTQIEAGSFTAVLGPSGSGKSTLLMTIAGFEMPESGSIVLDHVDVTETPPEKRGIGVVFQGYALFPHLTVAENIAYPLKARRWAKAAVGERVRGMAGLMEIETLLQRHPAQLSGGQRQRVAIARALAFRPRLLLLDEPLSALDRSLRDRMKAELQRIHRKLGVTIVMVTHDQDEASALADTVIVMESGRIIAKGSARQLYEAPHNATVAAFFGRANLLPVHFSADGALLHLENHDLERGAIAGQGNQLLVRPEAFSLSAKGGGLEAVVTSITFHAGRVMISCTTVGGTALMADLADKDAATLQIGQPIVLAVRRARLV